MIASIILLAAMQQSPKSHVVVTGDTLSAIATANGDSLAAVEAANPQIGNPDMIFDGQVVNLPGGSASTASVAPGTGTFGHPNRCGDGDGDGWDVPCGTRAPAPAQHAAPQQAPAPAQQAPAPQAPAASSGNAAPGSVSIPGMPQSLANCIWFRESTNGTNPAAGGNQFGIIPASGFNVSGDSVAQQEQVAGQIFAQSGGAAWSADGCPGT